MKKRIVGMLIIILFVGANSSMAFGSQISSYQGATSQSNFLDITLYAGSYQIHPHEDGTFEIEMEGFGCLLHPGTPVLPLKTIYVGLPPGATASSIELISEKTEIITTSLLPTLALGVADSSIANQITTPSEEIIFDTCYSNLGNSRLRKYSIATIQFTPIVYNILSNSLTVHKEITIRIYYDITEQLTEIQLSDTTMDAEAAKLIHNFEEIKSLYHPKTMINNPVTYDYVIICTSGVSTALNGFITWKTSIGYSINLVTVTWIIANYPGIDTQEKIRNFLVANYQAWSTKYVLIAGTHASIPMRTCWPDPSVHTADGQHDVPTDYYYADLTGNWDSDGDGFFGERGQDNIDLIPEVYVGRLPSDNAGTITSITGKIQGIEQVAFSGWKRNAILLGAVYGYANEDLSGNPRWDGAEVMEQIRTNFLGGFAISNMYETQGLSPCTYSCTHSLTNTNVKNVWGSTFGAGIVNWASHGVQTGANQWIWGWDDGDGVPETTNGEITWPLFIQSTDAPTLNNNKAPVVFAASCYCAHPETTNNLGAALLTSGAVAFIGATRVSWGSIGWTQPSHGGHGTVCYDFNDRIINKNEDFGTAMYQSKLYVWNNYPWYGWWDNANMYDFVLYGDPSQGMNLPPSTPIQPSGPQSGLTGIPYTYSTSTMDPSGDYLKYGWDWDGDSVVDQWDDNNGNYYPPNMPISTSHSWNVAGTYQVQVKAEDVYGGQSGFSQPLTVVINPGNVAPNQPQTPTGPTNGGVGVTYPYTTSTIDQNGDPIKYGWDWDGDMVVDVWDDNSGMYYPSGQIIQTSHSWAQQGTYTIRVLAEDIVGLQSSWSNPLTVSMPKPVHLRYQFPKINYLFSFFFHFNN
jgi:hypothetical protein